MAGVSAPKPPMTSRALLLLSFLLPCAALAGQTLPRQAPPAAAASAPSRFAATLVVTPDRNWRDKWNAARGGMPQFAAGREVRNGGQLAVLAFVSDPGVDAAGTTDVRCDFTVLRPDGTHAIDRKDTPCLQVRPAGPARVFLTTARLHYVAEPRDPRGTWVVRAMVRDRVRGRVAPLEATFEVK